AFTEHGEIHLHEAAVRATDLHGLTRDARADDGRPRALLAFGSDAAPADVLALLRTVPILRRYGIAPRALVAGDAIELQRALATERVPCQGVAPALLARGAADDVDLTPLRNVLAWERPALVRATGPLPRLATACRAAGVPLVEERPWRGVPRAIFAGGLDR